MKITWYGHAAFLVETQGLRSILDPFRSPDSGGYEPIAEPADLVVVSHENDRYHSHLGQIVEPFEVVRALELLPDGSVVRGIWFNVNIQPLERFLDVLPGYAVEWPRTSSIEITRATLSSQQTVVALAHAR